MISASVVRNGIALAATGWRYGTEHVIWVYFQGRYDSLQYVVYDTLYGTWAGPTMLSLDEGAVAGTALHSHDAAVARATTAARISGSLGNLEGISLVCLSLSNFVHDLVKP